ncbi:MAG: sporulation protein YqfD [Eubacteriales bacterium]
MIYRIFAFLFGYNLIKLPKSAAIATALIKKEIPLGQMRIEGDTILIDVISLSCRSVLKKLSAMGIEPISVSLHGLPHLLSAYKKRAGILIGIPLFIGILWISSLFVWEVHVVGNEQVDDETILSGLSDLGFSVGSYIPGVDVKTLCNEYLINSDEIAWISVNIIGTRAEVQVRDVLPAGQSEEPTPSNLVAVRDGLIERIELSSGQSVVGTGESVRAGQVLVTGYYQGKNEAVYRLEPSIAKVYARTTRSFSVQVPLTGESERETGQECICQSFLFFGNTVGISDRGSPYEKYTEEFRTDLLTLFGRVLPIGTTSHIYRECARLPFKLTEAEAAAIAQEKMASLVAQELADGEILSISASESCDGITYTIEWMVYCIEDIARSTPITGYDALTDTNKP